MTSRITLKETGLEIFPLCLGGNVFGWTANEEESFKVLDAFAEAGGNFFDTADVYSEWKEGNTGGDSEKILGKWMKSRGNRHQIVIATKVAKYSKRPGLSEANIKAAVTESLDRLQTDHIDLYYAHEDDTKVELAETLGAFNDLVKGGQVHLIGASNYSGDRLREAHKISTANGFAKYTALQNHYNLVERKEFESDAAIATRELGVNSFPYFGLARGFLTGKYQPGVTIESARAQGASAYFNEKGWTTLNKVTEIAKQHGESNSAIALAWLRAKGQVPIASARTVDQLREIMQVVELSASEVSQLDAVSNS